MHWGYRIDEPRAICQIPSANDRGINYVDIAPAYILGKSKPILAQAAERGLRWVWNHPKVMVVLSSMNQEDHIAENLHIADAGVLDSLTPDELVRIKQARDAYLSRRPVGCTGCGYCMPSPAGVNIPGILSCTTGITSSTLTGICGLNISNDTEVLSDEDRLPVCARIAEDAPVSVPQHFLVSALLQNVSECMEDRWFGVKAGALRTMVKQLKTARHISRGM